MAFGDQGQQQENRRRSSGESDGNFEIAVDAETPLQSRADIVNIGKMYRSRLPLILNSFK